MPFAGDRVAVRKSPAGGRRQRGLVLLNVTSAFTEPHKGPLLLPLPSFHTTTSATASTSSPSSTPTPPVSVKGQRGGGSSPPSPPNSSPTQKKPAAPTSQSAPTLEPSARKLNQRGASEDSDLSKPSIVSGRLPHTAAAPYVTL